MTHQNHQTNGASLEDCHTNFFALTDLCGIKWRKFTNGERPNASSDPLEDAILRSYSRCLQADILCVWRRIQSTKPEISDPNSLTFELNPSKVHPPLSLAAAKELWIFWYGEEPDLKDLVDAELLRIAANQPAWTGTWERGLTYECRSLLFKALHNLMERFVLTKDIVRFGKWFVQPCTSNEHHFDKCSQHLSFSFTFFVHGDTVCASIDLREHPTVRPLTKEHLIEAAASFAVLQHNTQSSDANGLVSPLINVPCHDRFSGNAIGNDGNSEVAPRLRKVILAPFGMAAILTGNSYKTSDPITEKILEEWAAFFPLCNKENTNVPPVVEVISGGHKMYHPAIFVLVTDLDNIHSLEEVEDQALQAKSTSSVDAAFRTNSNTGDHPKPELNSINIPPTIKTTNIGTNSTTTTNKYVENSSRNARMWAEKRQTSYYDTCASNFNCNTTNTHVPPQAAMEMPERGWQDCISNLLHWQMQTINTRVESTSSVHLDDLMASSGAEACDSKQRLQQQIQSQQAQHKCFWDFIDPTSKTNCVCAKTTLCNSTSHGGVSSYLQNTINDTMAIHSSPGTPLPPHVHTTLSQPASVSPSHHLLTISPRGPTPIISQPPATPIDHVLDKNIRTTTPSSQHDTKNLTALPYAHTSDIFEVLLPTDCLTTRNTPTNTLLEQATQIKTGGAKISVKKFDIELPVDVGNIKLEPVYENISMNTQLTTSNSKPNINNNSKTNNKNNSTENANALGAVNDFLKFYRPPKLSSKDIDCFANEGNLKLDVLYDFSAQDAWVNHPVKRFKPNEEVPFNRNLLSSNLYESNAALKALMPSGKTFYNQRLLAITTTTTTTTPTVVSTVSSAEESNDDDKMDNFPTTSGTCKTASTTCDNVNDLEKLASSKSNTNNMAVNYLPDINQLRTKPCTVPYFPDLNIKTELNLSPSKEKLTIGGNLFTAEGLNPSLNDLEQLFETSSNDECSSLHLHSPPGSNNPTKMPCGSVGTDATIVTATGLGTMTATIGAFHSITQTSVNSSGNINNSNAINVLGSTSTVQVEDLTKMFPTPPSHEQHHPSSSPCQMDISIMEINMTTSNNISSVSNNNTIAEVNSYSNNTVSIGPFGKIPSESHLDSSNGPNIKKFNCYRLENDIIDDWSYVYRPPKQAAFVGSAKYAPLLKLPSQTMPPLALPSNCVYKANWKSQQQQKSSQQQQQHSNTSNPQQKHSQFYHQHLHEFLSTSPRGIQLSRNSFILPNAFTNQALVGGTSLLLNQLNCTQSTVHQQQQLQRGASIPPISPTIGSISRNSPLGQHQQRLALPPPSYELSVVSPATSTSSYMNKQLHSLEPPHTPQSVHANSALGLTNNINHNNLLQTLDVPKAESGAPVLTRELPEVNSLIVNILLYDTALNVFRDHNFDSSTVCVCNADSQKVGNIRGGDTGAYVPLPGSTFNPIVATQSTRTLSATSQLNLKFLNNKLDSPGAGFGHITGSTPTMTTTTAGIVGTNSNNGNQHITGYVDDDPVDCTCGFSAVVNRRLAHRAGLFYEDELEITGCAEDPAIQKKPSLRSLLLNLNSAFGQQQLSIQQQQLVATAASTPTGSSSSSNSCLVENSNATQQTDHVMHAIFDLLLDQCSGIQNSSSSIHRALHRHRLRLAKQQNRSTQVVCSSKIANVLEYVDAHDIVCLALEQARLMHYQHQQPHNRYRVCGDEFTSQQQFSPFTLPAAAVNRFKRSVTNNQQISSNISSINNTRNSNVVGNSIQTTAASLCWSLSATVHRWSFLPAGFKRSNKEIVRSMNFIQPMLQNAFHSKSRSAAGSKEATYTVSGPLTWRQFHRLAGRASGQCEPQPIPSVIVGHDKDWISVAPLAIHYWDKLLLEPYSYARDIAYLIICPDNEFVIANTKNYFKELSTTYEMCKLGRHTPIRGWDGILTVGPRIYTESFTTNLDDWLRTLNDATLSEQMRHYAHVFQNLLTPYLNRIPADKTLLQPRDSTCGPPMYLNRERSNINSSPLATSTNTSNTITSSSSISCSNSNNSVNVLHSGNSTNANVVMAMDIDKSHSTPKLESGSSNTDQSSTDINYSDSNKADIKVETKPTIQLGDPLGMADTMDDINPPAIMLYVVEPFTFGCDSPQLERLVCIALLRCYTELLSSIPESVRANLNIQIISLESVLELGRTRSRKRFSDEIKALALSIFSQCRRHMLHAQNVKSLTGFGTAANMEVFLKSKDEKNRRAYRMYTPPYILAPIHEKNDKSDFLRASSSITRGLNEQKYSVMYCNYCMSEDQSWLLATVTDDRGELLEKVCINIDVPNRLRRRKAPARRIGLKKLMDFILGLISQSSQPWRLVIGRIGRIGHSELKSWSYLLSKQNLQKASKQLKDLCKQCTLTFPPSILSACLVTLEPDAKLRVMPDQFTPDERFSQISMQNPLSTPQDVTCTHILVFPTSAVCLSFTRQFQNEPQVDLDNDFLNFEECEDENEGFTDADFMGDLLEWEPQLGRMSNHGSPDRMEDNRSWQSANGNNFNSTQQQDVEEAGAINQQPLAVGYMVSTAPTGRMPSWFWSACPHLEDVCPVFLKTALHLHVPNIQITDDILNSTNAHSSATDHPLDSTLTADVLRYVLEGYNALSWLALDSNTHDRLSCLPINVQTLMELYYLTAAIA